MKLTQLSAALNALSAHTIGTREAAVLCASVGGKTVQQIADATGHTVARCRSGIQQLRAKGMLVTRYALDGTISYQPSPNGLKIIEETLTAAKP